MPSSPHVGAHHARRHLPWQQGLVGELFRGSSQPGLRDRWTYSVGALSPSTAKKAQVPVRIPEHAEVPDVFGLLIFWSGQGQLQRLVGGPAKTFNAAGVPAAGGSEAWVVQAGDWVAAQPPEHVPQQYPQLVAARVSLEADDGQQLIVHQLGVSVEIQHGWNVVARSPDSDSRLADEVIQLCGQGFDASGGNSWRRHRVRTCRRPRRSQRLDK